MKPVSFTTPLLRKSGLATAIALALSTSMAHGAAAPAGSVIANKATATYKVAGQTAPTVTSNEVRTTVTQVGSFTLVDNRTQNVNPNGKATLSHTLTNTGNGTDSYSITLADVNAGDDFNFTNLKVFLDANKDGIPDSATPLAAGDKVTLNAGDSVDLIVESLTPNTAVDGNTGQYTITATSDFDSATDVDTDTITVTGGAVIQFTKTAPASVAAGDTFTYTITLNNTGNTVAEDIVITDTMPTNVTYVANSAVYSGTSLTDGADADGFVFNATTKQFTYNAANLAPNASATLTFQVTASNTLTPADTISNTANVEYDDDQDDNTPKKDTDDPATTSIDAVYTGTINDDATDNYADSGANTYNPATTPNPTGDDVVVAESVVLGQKVTLDLIVHNTGNVQETYNIAQITKTLTNTSALPSGSVVRLLDQNGVPLTDSGTDGVPDVVLAASANTTVKVEITLPNNTTIDASNPENLAAKFEITPVNNNSATDTAHVVIKEVLAAPALDLTDGDGNDATLEGVGTDNNTSGSPADTYTGSTAQPVLIPVTLTNSGGSSDTITLSETIPSCATISYFENNGTAAAPTKGVAVTNDQVTLTAGSTTNLVAEVNLSSCTAGDTIDVGITATSGNDSNTSDTIYNEIVISKRSLELITDQTGTVLPGGTKTYTHTLTNNGNVTEGDDAGELTLNINELNNNIAGSVVTVYVDTNGNGTGEASEIVTNNTDLETVLTGTNGNDGLVAGESVNIIVKVEAGAASVGGQSNTTQVTVTTTGNIDGITPPALVDVTDVTNVSNGLIQLLKKQALDANCDGTADAAYVDTQLTAKPGECISYQITATNQGSVSVTDIEIKDSIPSFTTLKTNPVQTPAAAVVTPATASGQAAGTEVKSTLATLAPNATSTLTFSVEVDD